jgi:hypothetical protein
MGLKEETVEGIGFQRLTIFRPGIIAGNAHTPRYAAWLGVSFRDLLARLSKTISGAPLSLNSSAILPQTGLCISKMRR